MIFTLWQLLKKNESNLCKMLYIEFWYTSLESFFLRYYLSQKLNFQVNFQELPISSLVKEKAEKEAQTDEQQKY